MEERELTPTEIEVKKMEILNQIRREEEKDRRIWKMQKHICNKKITSMRMLKKNLKKNDVHSYMITRAIKWVKMIGLYHNVVRHIRNKNSFFKDINIEDLEKPQRISYYDIMMMHIEIINK